MSRTLLGLLCAICMLSVVATADRHVVELWTVNDVQVWVNNTVGYPEYSPYFKTHLIDGPTLLNLEVEDLEDTMPMINRVHIAKFKGHLAIVKDQCLCKAEALSTDFWSYIRSHQTRTWILGSAAIFAPRAALIAAYLFDYAAYEDMTYVNVDADYKDYFLSQDGEGTEKGAKNRQPASRRGRVSQEFSWFFALAYWVIGLLFPGAYFLLNFLPYISTNFLVVLVLSINFIVEQHREVFIWMSFFYGDLRQRSVKDIVLMICPLPTLFPIVGLLLSFVAPLALLQLAVVALMIFSLFIGVGFVMMFFSAGEGAQDEAAAKRAEGNTNSANASSAGHSKVD